jgi:hypothetical protein
MRFCEAVPCPSAGLTAWASTKLVVPEGALHAAHNTPIKMERRIADAMAKLTRVDAKL